MSYSEIDICNLALSKLGVDSLSKGSESLRLTGPDNTQTAVISTREQNTSQSEQAILHYPVARDAALEAHPWSFAMRRMSISPDEDGGTVYTLPDKDTRILYNIIPQDYIRLNWEPDPQDAWTVRFAFNYQGTLNGDSTFFARLVALGYFSLDLYNDGTIRANGDSGQVTASENFVPDQDYYLSVRFGGSTFAYSVVVVLNGSTVITTDYDSAATAEFVDLGGGTITNPSRQLYIFDCVAASDEALGYTQPFRDWPCDDGYGYIMKETNDGTFDSTIRTVDADGRYYGSWRYVTEPILRVYRLYSESDYSPASLVTDWDYEDGKIYYSGGGTLYMKYITSVLDTSKYSNKFVEAMATCLAAKMAVYLTENQDLANTLMNNFYGLIEKEATAADGSQGRHDVINSRQLTSIRSR